MRRRCPRAATTWLWPWRKGKSTDRRPLPPTRSTAPTSTKSLSSHQYLEHRRTGHDAAGEADLHRERRLRSQRWGMGVADADTLGQPRLRRRRAAERARAAECEWSACFIFQRWPVGSSRVGDRRQVSTHPLEMARRAINVALPLLTGSMPHCQARQPPRRQCRSSGLRNPACSPWERTPRSSRRRTQRDFRRRRFPAIPSRGAHR